MSHFYSNLGMAKVSKVAVRYASAKRYPSQTSFGLFSERVFQFNPIHSTCTDYGNEYRIKLRNKVKNIPSGIMNESIVQQLLCLLAVNSRTTYLLCISSMYFE